MTALPTTPSKIALGEPVPWFGARTAGSSRVDLPADAGRWVFGRSQ